MYNIVLGHCDVQCNSWFSMFDLLPPKHEFHVSYFSNVPSISRNKYSYLIHDVWGKFGVLVYNNCSEYNVIDQLINEADYEQLRDYLDDLVKTHITTEQVMHLFGEVYKHGVSVGDENARSEIRTALGL